MKVVFVCTGNTCRSPMAEYLFRSMLEDTRLDDVEVDSAGVAAREGAAVSMKTVRVLEEEGIDGASMHQAQPVSEVEVGEGDWVLSMSRAHHVRLPRVIKEGLATTAVLKEFVGRSGGFSDPYGRELEEYQSLMEDMKPVLRDLLRKLENTRRGS